MSAQKRRLASQHEAEILDERRYWQELAAIFGWTLFGWSSLEQATFFPASRAYSFQIGREVHRALIESLGERAPRKPAHYMTPEELTPVRPRASRRKANKHVHRVENKRAR